MAQVTPGAQAWSADGASEPPGDVGILVVHGFTGNPVSLRPLAEGLAERGFAVALPRLPGHGTRWQDLQRTTWHDWVREAAAAFQHLRSTTRAQVLVGLSMGGAIALHLAQTRAAEVAGLVLINPWLYSSDRRLKALPLLKLAVPAIPGVGNDICKPGGDEKPYPKVPLKALASVLALQRQVRERLPQVLAPTLILTSRHDHVVEPANSALVLDSIGSPDSEQRWLEHSYHVATLDHDAPQILQATADFAQRVAQLGVPKYDAGC
ncbi:MAG: alpha/beta fold hydrolase [Actinomycetota bacterium]|jgi:carboxylesterase|nr:alpha/beta fold hydrolase [Euzebyaceae bacterium]MDQ3451128.1 alpha/beta fold hydrolase [Actinomycetota bacterium]